MPDDTPEPELTAIFAGHLQRNQSQLFGYVHSLVRNLNDAEDLFQQVALILWRKFSEFEQDRSFLAWGCGIARLEACNFLRTRGRSKLYFSDELNLMLITAQMEMIHDETAARRAALDQCITKLRERDRRLVEECYAENGSVAQTAQRQARSAQSVHNSLSRIRRALYECIHKTLGEEGRWRAAP